MECPFCGTVNDDNCTDCVECGKQRTVMQWLIDRIDEGYLDFEDYFRKGE